MSEKVTFQELIESISNETDHSKNFTRNFLKDFVDVIHQGLGREGKVNIAGFGKFELRKMKERTGYNPHLREKITIPAHNKIVFKPYKEVRDLVNAPYANLESKILEEQTEEKQEKKDKKKLLAIPVRSSDKHLQEDQIPAKTSTIKEPVAEAPARFKSRFTFDESKPVESEIRDDDIVEYRPGLEYSGDIDLDDLLRVDVGKETVEPEPTVAPDTTERLNGDKITPEPEQEPELEPEINNEQVSTPGNLSHTISGERDSDHQSGTGFHIRKTDSEPESTRYIALAATGILFVLVIAAGVWYYHFKNRYSTSEPASRQEQTSQTGQVNQPANREAEPVPATEKTGDNRESATAGTPEDRTQQQEPETYAVIRGQTLWSLADTQYNDPYLWPWIYDTNKRVISNPDLIYSGQSLSLPVPDEAGGGLSNRDSLEVAIGYVATYRWYKDHADNRAKYFLWAAKLYDKSVLEHVNIEIAEEDLAFANRVR